MVGRRHLAVIDEAWARRGSTAVVVVAGAVGTLERIWLLAHLHLFGDEAIVGLMARQIGSGHPLTFYWGQTYGGVEPYVAALMRLVNDGPVGLNATPMVLSAIASVLVGAIVAEVAGSRRLGTLAGAVAWIWPYSYVWNSVREGGFRFTTLCCGLGMVLGAVRMRGGRGGKWTCLLFGLAAGLGWWSSPEIVYFVVPTAVVVVAAIASEVKVMKVRGNAGGGAVWYRGRIAAAVLGALVGSLPWIYTNIGNGFASLNLGAQVTPSTTPFSGRLSTFFHQTLPVQLGLKALFTGAWIGGPIWGRLLMLVISLIILAAGIRAIQTAQRGDIRPLALGLGIIALPFLIAANPASDYWVDGRYGVYVGPIIVTFVFSAAFAFSPQGLAPDPTERRHRVRRNRSPLELKSSTALGLSAVIVVAAGLLTITDGQITSGTPVIGSSAYFSSWHDPDQEIRLVVTNMVRSHIRYAYGTYWTSYDLDFLGSGRVVVTPSPHDFNRWTTATKAVANAATPSWLFFPPARTTAATLAFSNPQVGPGGYSETAFVALLRQLRVGYHIVHLGILDAVTPDRAVTLP
ncbi:MAG: hypothetical protein QOJ44_396 [Acidimicrobiaceae bacterium]|jgi:hypothetical protein|nr:hypothetical protein [Acidimicrobiaceae bacterium]